MKLLFLSLRELSLMFGSLDGVFTLYPKHDQADPVSQIFPGLRDHIKAFRCGLIQHALHKHMMSPSQQQTGDDTGQTLDSKL